MKAEYKHPYDKSRIKTESKHPYDKPKVKVESKHLFYHSHWLKKLNLNPNIPFSIVTRPVDHQLKLKQYAPHP